jgi:hypothetical protein
VNLIEIEPSELFDKLRSALRTNRWHRSYRARWMNLNAPKADRILLLGIASSLLLQPTMSLYWPPSFPHSPRCWAPRRQSEPPSHFRWVDELREAGSRRCTGSNFSEASLICTSFRQPGLTRGNRRRSPPPLRGSPRGLDVRLRFPDCIPHVLVARDVVPIEHADGAMATDRHCY